MARNFPADTRGQKVLEELYEKEARAQLIWFLKNEKAKIDNPGKIITPAAIADTKVPKLDEVLPTSLMEKLRDLHKTEPKTKACEQSSATLKVDQLTDEPKPDMIQPDEATKRLLYDGISKEGRGRINYLTERHKMDLEQKYLYPVLSSMEYGWGHGELVRNTVGEQRRRGRMKIVEESFYRRTGIPFKHCAEMV